jgi:hypothetical protein
LKGIWTVQECIQRQVMRSWVPKLSWQLWNLLKHRSLSSKTFFLFASTFPEKELSCRLGREGHARTRRRTPDGHLLEHLSGRTTRAPVPGGPAVWSYMWTPSISNLPCWLATPTKNSLSR